MLYWIYIILNLAAATIFSGGSAKYTDYYTSDEVKTCIDSLEQKYPNLKIDGTKISYGNGSEKILILGGFSACPLCTLQVLALAEKLARSITDYNTNDANNSYYYSTVDLYPIVNINDYDNMINNISTSKNYKEVQKDGKIHECIFDCSSEDICCIIKDQMKDYSTIINFQGFSKNSILYPPPTSESMEQIYTHIKSFIKGFNLQSSYDRFGTRKSFMDLADENIFILQIELEPKANRFSVDFPMVESYALLIYEEFFMKYNNIPDAIIEKISSSAKPVENEAYNITVLLKIANRSPFNLNRNFEISIRPTEKQKFLDFQSGKNPSINSNVTSLNGPHIINSEPLFVEATNYDFGVFIKHNFTIPPYGRIDADMEFMQRPRHSVGGFYHYLIKMNTNSEERILLRNYTNNFTEILEKLPTQPGEAEYKELVLALMFFVFVICILGIICCVMITHKPGSLFY